MVGFGIQVNNGGVHAGPADLWAPLLLIVASAVIGALLLPLLRITSTRARAAGRARRIRRRRLHEAAGAERRARAMMSELCPYGWRAQITLYEGQDHGEHGEPVRGAVGLDWFELQPGGGQPAVMRRVWAASVGEALEAMVADRRTDETLEQIELRATADGAFWPDL
jgi:hypothetical protein